MLLLAGVVLVLLLPSILSQGLLAAALRQGLGAEVGRARLGWTSGVDLRDLQLEAPVSSTASGYAYWSRSARLDASLLDLARAHLSGGKLRGALHLAGAGLRLEFGGGPESAPAETAPQAASDEPPLPCALDLEVALEGFDLHIRERGLPLLLLEGLRGRTRLELARDGSFELRAPLELRVDAVRYPLGSATAPWASHITLEDAALHLERLRVDRGGDFDLEGVLTAPRLHAAGLDFQEARLTATSRAGRIELALTGRHPTTVGTLRFTSTIDRSQVTAWPVDLDLELSEIPVRGAAAEYAPCLLPLTLATAGRRAGFPPLSVQAKASFTLSFGQDGLDGQRTLDSLAAQGEVALAPGELDASLLLRGYVAALTRLEVGSLLAGVLPPRWSFSGGRGPFELAGERLRLHSFPIRTPLLELTCAAEVGLVSGDYRVRLRGQGKGELPRPAQAVLASLDRAGGIGLFGNVYAPEVPGAELPAPDALLEAIRLEGAADVWAERGGPLLRDALRALPGAPR